MYIDIYEQPTLSYSGRKAIRSVALPPTVENVQIKSFNFGDLINATITLDQTSRVFPKRIKYIILDENGEKTHYYVTGYRFIQLNRYELTLLLNPWPGVSKQKKAYIKRSNAIPYSVLDHRGEAGLNFNKVKSNEIMISDEFGAGAKWGLLYLARTKSDVEDEGGVTVQLSRLNYNIRGNSLPLEPGKPIIVEGQQVANFYNASILNEPVPPNTLSLGTGYTYTRATNPPAAPNLPSNLSTRYVSTANNSMVFPTNTFVLQSRVIGGRQDRPWPVGWNDPFYIHRYDGSWQVTIYSDGSMHVAAGTGTKGRRANGALASIDTSLGAGTTGKVSDILEGRRGILDDSIYYSAGISAGAPETVDFPAYNIPAGSITAPQYPQTGDVQPLVNGAYKASNGNTYQYNFTNGTTDVVTNVTGTLNPTTRTVTIKGGSGQQCYNFPTGVTFRASQTRTYQIASQQYQLFDYTVVRRTYSNSTLNRVSNTVSLSSLTSTSAPVYLPDNSDVTFRNYIIGDSGGAGFVGIGNQTTFAYAANISNTHFTNNTMATVFSANNVNYVYNENILEEGHYQIDYGQGPVIVRMLPTTETRDVVAPFNFNVSVAGYTSSNVTNGTTFSVTSSTRTAQSNADVRLSLSVIGQTEVIPYDIDYKITVDNIDNATIWSEPFAIMAVPLFPIRYMLADGVIRQNNTDETQRVFHDFIRKYSGSGQIVDAQYSPYAPREFKAVFKNDAQGQYIDMRNMATVGSKQDGSQADSIPYVVLDDANTSLSFYCDVNPYVDKRKEYTLRNLRLCSPNFDSIFEFNYYDFNPQLHNNEGRGDLRIDVNVTFKPFGLFMHAHPFIHNNSLMGVRDFEDFRGLICGQAIFQCSMSSSAFETYKRQNTMYDQIQQRTVETMGINFNAERTNEQWSSAMRIVGNVTGGAGAGLQAGMMAGPIGGAVGAVIGGIVGGVTQGAASAEQMRLNETLRQREAADQKFYYEANIKNIQQQPDTISRISSFNQKIQDRFAVLLEVWGPTTEEVGIYEDQIATFGRTINAVDMLDRHLITGNYIEGYLPYSDEPQHIHDRLNDDLEKGVYYYEQV